MTETLPLPPPVVTLELPSFPPSAPTPVVPTAPQATDPQVWFLRPPHQHRYSKITIENPKGVCLEIAVSGNVKLVEALLDEPCGDRLRAALWNAGLRSRRTDGRGYVVVTLVGATIVIDAMINSVDPSEFGSSAAHPRFVVTIGNENGNGSAPTFNTVEEASLYRCGNESAIPHVGTPLVYGPGWYQVYEA